MDNQKIGNHEFDSQKISNQEIIDLESRYSAPNYRPMPIAISRAEDVWVWDVEGKRYLDCIGAFASMCQGHRHPRIIEAMIEQLQRVTHVSRAFYNDRLGTFLKELCELTGYEMALPMNTGVEAVETAVKTARKWAYRVKGVPQDKAEIIVCMGNFHGRTITAVSMSTAEKQRTDSGPFTPGFKVIPFGDAAALAAAITLNTCAFLLEPVQGDGGVIVPPDGYLAEVQEICRQNNVLLIADEIQSGLGRCGAFRACDLEDVKPDITTLGKALGGGIYPLSAVLGSADLLNVYRPGEHGSTFGGNPLAAAVGIASLRVLKDEKLPQRSQEMGAYMKGRLQRIESDLIKEVRGKGLLIGVELNVPARPFCESLINRGLLCKDTHTYTIRFAPPLTIKKQEMDWALAQIEEVLQ